jgi:hypothetical protein
VKSAALSTWSVLLRAILRYLSAETPLVSASTPVLASIVPIFAEYSSFVHGGPWSDRDMYGYGSPTVLKKCEEQAETAFMMAASVFLFTSLTICREFPEHGKAFTETKREMDEFSGRIKRKKKRKEERRAGYKYLVPRRHTVLTGGFPCWLKLLINRPRGRYRHALRAPATCHAARGRSKYSRSCRVGDARLRSPDTSELRLGEPVRREV